SLLPKGGGFGDWTDPKQSYLIQKGPRPFASTYDRVAGGTQHWLGTCLRFVPADFKMKTNYPSVPQFVDWPIGYDDLNDWYGKAEEELGVSAMWKSKSISASTSRLTTSIRCRRSRAHWSISPRLTR